MAVDDLLKLARAEGTTQPADLTNQPLTLGIVRDQILIWNELQSGVFESRNREFMFEGLPKPAEFAELLGRSASLGYASVLQPEFIRDVTCSLAGDHASGEISFDAQLYKGRVRYRANRTEGKWQIDEFSLPARDWRFVRNHDDTWQWFDHFSLLTKDRKLPVHDVAVEVKLGDKPLTANRLSFTLRQYPEFSFRGKKSGEEAKSCVSLVPGQYIVVVSTDNPQLAKFGNPSLTPLVVDVKPGQTELMIQIPQP